MDLFTQLMGGEQNMPPKKLAPEATEPAPLPDAVERNTSNIVDSFGNLQVYDEILAQQPAVGTVGPVSQQRKKTKPVAASQDPAATGSSGPQPSDDDGSWECDPRMGEPCEVGTSFIPWLAAAKFPYKFIKPDYKERIDLTFFAGGKLYTPGWDL